MGFLAVERGDGELESRHATGWVLTTGREHTVCQVQDYHIWNVLLDAHDIMHTSHRTLQHEQDDSLDDVKHLQMLVPLDLACTETSPLEERVEEMSALLEGADVIPAAETQD